MSEKENLVKLFTGIGLTENKAKDTIKNPVLSESLKSAINEVCELFFCTSLKIISKSV